MKGYLGLCFKDERGLTKYGVKEGAQRINGIHTREWQSPEASYQDYWSY
jgi:hypothetical protein